MKFSDIKEGVLFPLVGMVTVIVFVTLPFWIIHAHFEAKTFHELTGREVSTWQALWVQLRVEECRDK